MCGLFGLVSYGHSNNLTVNKLIKALGKASETRGTDAGGVSYIDLSDNKLVIRRNKGAISKNGVFDLPINGTSIMGHTRLGTGASEKHNFNNHPFPSTKSPFAMAHNGVLSNDWELEKDNALPKSKVETDSYIVVRLLDHIHNGKLNDESIISVSEMLEGTFNLTFQDKESIWVVKHNNPMHILDIHELGIVVYASTKDIIVNALNSFYDLDFTDYLMSRSGDSYANSIVPASGDILRIMNNGIVENFKFKPKPYSSKYSYSGGSHYYGRAYGFDYGYGYPRDDDYYSDKYQEDMATEYGIYKAKESNSLGTDTRVIDLYGGLAYLPKSERYLIFNGTDSELSYAPYGTLGSTKVYSELLGKVIDIDTATSDAYTIGKHAVNLFKNPFTKDMFKDIVVDSNYVTLMKTLSKFDVFVDIMNIIKRTAYPSSVKKMIKNLIAFHMYVMYDFDLAENVIDAQQIAIELHSELNKILDYVHYSKLYKLYEYIQCSIEYRTMNYYMQFLPDLNEYDELDPTESEVF